MTRAYLSLGSNLGDRLAQLAEATRRIRALPYVTLFDVSPVYETVPLGAGGTILQDQPPYLNCAVAIETVMSARELRAQCAEIERAMGRGERGRWESRTIDIDLVLFGNEQIVSRQLTVPHPRLHERAFVLRPLVDIDAHVSAPGVGPLAALLPEVAAQGCTMQTTAAAFRALVG